MGALGDMIVSISELDIKVLEDIFQMADYLADLSPEKRLNVLKGKVLASLFYEPSSRTSNRFKSAMYRLGGNVIGFDGAGTSSVKKKESLADTIQTFSQYSDVIVLRHPSEGAARLAKEVSSVPVVNGGDGSNEHPTQTLLDLYTIYNKISSLAGGKFFSLFEGLKIGFVGDLRYSRTVHSLYQALSLLSFSLPGGIEIHKWVPAVDVDFDFSSLQVKGKIEVTPYESLRDLLSVVDFVYVTRLQRERFADSVDYERLRRGYVIDRDLLLSLDSAPYIMHPLPRNEEIHPDVDDLPPAIYFYQMRCGLLLSQAVLAMSCGFSV